MSMLEVKDLSIHFGGVKAVQNVTFNIDSIQKQRRGTFLHITGWAFEPGCDTDVQRSSVVLVKGDRKFVLPTQIAARPDVTRHFAADFPDRETWLSVHVNMLRDKVTYNRTKNVYRLSGERSFYDRAGFVAGMFIPLLPSGEYAIALQYRLEDKDIVVETPWKVQL